MIGTGVRVALSTTDMLSRRFYRTFTSIGNQRLSRGLH